MKRILVPLFFALLLPALASADWSVSVTWTRSVGPDLASEQVLYGGATKCTVLPAQPTTCQFVVPTLGQPVVIRSQNSQGAYSETAPVLVADVPAPASGILVNVSYVAP